MVYTARYSKAPHYIHISHKIDRLQENILFIDLRCKYRIAVSLAKVFLGVGPVTSYVFCGIHIPRLWQLQLMLYIEANITKLLLIFGFQRVRRKSSILK